MIDDESSRLEIVESCISEFGEMYPDYEYDDWSKIVKSLMPKDEEEDHYNIAVKAMIRDHYAHNEDMPALSYDTSTTLFKRIEKENV